MLLTDFRATILISTNLLIFNMFEIIAKTSEIVALCLDAVRIFVDLMTHGDYFIAFPWGP